MISLVDFHLSTGFLFPLVCVLFSWIGYIVSCCLASSVAAQAGAAAGLGLSLVIKTILVEVSLLVSVIQDAISNPPNPYLRSTTVPHDTILILLYPHANSLLSNVPYSGKYWRIWRSEKKTPSLYQPNFCLTHQARVSSSIV